jgi:hypothetical protein
MKDLVSISRIQAVVLTIAALLAAPASSQASLFIDTWGISYGNWQVNSVAPANCTTVVEDWTGGDDGYLDPGYGGDEYDIEAAYMATDAQYLYLAVVTGFPITGRADEGDFYEPGDLALDLGGDGQYDFAVDVSAGGALRSGDLTWETPLRRGHVPWGGVSGFLRASSWNESSAIEGFSYAEWQDRYAIEAIVNLDDVGPADSYGLHWTMGCGNDYVNVLHPTEGPVNPVPEPASLILFGTGLGIAGAYSRWRRRR